MLNNFCSPNLNSCGFADLFSVKSPKWMIALFFMLLDKRQKKIGFKFNSTRKKQLYTNSSTIDSLASPPENKQHARICFVLSV